MVCKIDGRVMTLGRRLRPIAVWVVYLVANANGTRANGIEAMFTEVSWLSIEERGFQRDCNSTLARELRF